MTTELYFGASVQVDPFQSIARVCEVAASVRHFLSLSLINDE